MRPLLLAIPALLAVIAVQRPEWTRQAQEGWGAATARLAGLGGRLGLLPDARTIAERAPAEAPERATALAAIGRVAEGRKDLAATAANADALKDPAAAATARERVQALLRSAAATMAGSEAIGELRSLREAREHLAALREEAAAARVAGDARTDAAALEARVAAASGELARATDALVDRLAAIGVRVSRDAAANLAASVNGDDVVALLGAYANAERLEGELRASVTQPPQDNEAVLRRYYAVHATLLAVLETVQAEVAARLDAVHMPRLEAVEREVQALREDARARLRLAVAARDPGLQAALEANLRAQDLTLRAAGLYRRHLQEQRTALGQALDRTRAARGVADNTARTAELALDLAAMLRDADRDFDAVVGIRPPVVVPFEGETLRREFEGLSRRLGQQPTS